MAYLPQGNKHCFLLPLVFLLCFYLWQLVSAQKRINNLPGFDGPLPFALETGYVEVDEEKGVELFYYFIESERNPEKDPLLIWLTGGPGCSSLSGLVFEIGPLGFDLENYVDGLPSLYYKLDSWTQVSSVIFVDSPVETGFSYSRLWRGLKDLTLWLFWLEAHPKFKSNPLYISGSSYSGKIIPALVLEIAIAKESHGASFNLKGYLIGNPVTDTNFDDNSRIPFYHGMAIISDELNESTKKSCSGKYVNQKDIHCAKYLNVVGEMTKHLNPDNILDPLCSPRLIIKKFNNEEVSLSSSGLLMDCKLYTSDNISEFWANNDTVRDALGIRKGTVVHWHRCNRSLLYTYDIESAVQYHLVATNKGYTALIYSGDHDEVAPYIGTQAWIRSLNFSIVDDWRPWYSDGQVAGFTRRYSNNLTFATVKGAGHTATRYKPKECLAMVSRWLSGAPL